MKKAGFFLSWALAGRGMCRRLSKTRCAHCLAKKVGMDAEHLSLVDDVIWDAIRAEDIPGAVLAVVRHGKMVYLKAYGNRQLVPDTLPMTTETVFDMASVSKCVGTTLSIMQLIERGQIRLVDPVDVYLPDFQPWEDKETGRKIRITVADLLTHTSGLPAYGPTEELIEKYGSPSPEGLLEYICHCPRIYKPKEGHVYSCLNFITLQHILEKVTGTTLAAYAQENVFDALGLQHTTYNPQGETLALCAPTEVQEDGLPLIGKSTTRWRVCLTTAIPATRGIFQRRGFGRYCRSFIERRYHTRT